MLCDVINVSEVKVNALTSYTIKAATQGDGISVALI